MRAKALPILFLAATLTAAAQSPAATPATQAPAACPAKPNTPPAIVAAIKDVQSLLADGKLTEAQAAANAAVAANPNSGDAQALVGLVRIRSGNLGDATQAFQTAVALDHCSALTHFGYARLAQLNSRHATAAKELAVAHTLAPADPEITLAFLTNPGVDENPAQPSDARATALAAFLATSPAVPADALARAQVTLAILQQHLTCTPVEANAKAVITLNPIMYLGTRVRSWGIKGHVENADLPILELDPSVSGIVLNPGDAKKAGVKPLLATAPGKNDIYYGVASRIKFGPAEYKNCPVRVAPAAMLGNANSLIGPDTFQDRTIRIDYVNKTVTLNPFSTPAPTVPTNRTVTAEEKNWTPVYLSHGVILAPTLVNKKGPFLFMLDPAEPQSIITSKAGDGTIITLRTLDTNIHGYSGAIVKAFPTYNGSDDDHALVLAPDGKYLKVTQPLKVPTFNFANTTYLDGDTIVFDLSPKSRDLGEDIYGLIGLSTLREYFINLDYRNGLVRLEYDPDHRYYNREINGNQRQN